MALEQTQTGIVFNGDGSTVDLSVPFPVFDADHLVLTITDPDGAVRLLGIGIDYQAAINRDASGNAISANIILTVPLPIGWKLEAKRIVPIVQPVRLGNQGGTPPKTVEREFDYLTMIDQQLATGQAELKTDVEEMEEDITGLTEDLDNEIAARIQEDEALHAADSALQNAINAEETARIQADNQLQAAINTKANQSALAAEIQARIQGDSNLRTDLTAEAQIRAAAVAALQAAIAILTQTKLGFPPADNKTYAIRNGFFVEIDAGLAAEDGDGFFFFSQSSVRLKALANSAVSVFPNSLVSI